MSVLTLGTVLASHPEVSLPGSNFEIDTDANLIVNDTGNLDWASVNETRKPDQLSGSGDDSFGNGTKEDTAVPSVIDGSIPPNKSDLKNFGVYLETTPSGARFLNLFWHRVQEPQGTTNMDFEFNQSSTLSTNGVTPVRTAGDLLIQYDLSQGGTNPQLFLSRWLTSGSAACEASNNKPCWSARTNLTAAGDASGSINTSAIAAGASDGLGAISSRTFGEAQLDFDALTGGSGQCVSFGSAYLKSRSSDSFTAAVKDFIAPAPLNLSQCGTVIIRKQTSPDENPNATNFGYTKSFTSNPSVPNTFTLQDDGVFSNTSVLPGTGYTVVEDVIPANYAFTSLDCSASTGVTPVIAGAQVTFTIDAPSDVLDCTYTNTLQQGAIEIIKTRKHEAAPGTDPVAHAGVTFKITGGDLPAAGVTAVTGADGTVCVDDLTISSVAGNYTVTETVPTGYVSDDTTETAAVIVGDCDDATHATVEFLNTPLTNINVTVDSQIPGGTASDIDCDWQDPDEHADTDPVTGDGSLGENNLAPGTYTCVIVVDP